jgi:hypothetical protein
MPQVLSSPVSQVITNGGTDLFSYPNTAAPSILGLQTPPSQPLPPGTATAANLLSPDLQIAAQLKNFPADLYDLTPGSVLMHFMQALLGNAGAGQLRRRQMIARLQQAITSTRFYDLDSFYGALFGAQRGPSGALPVNPNTGLPADPYGDLASPDGWDQIEAIDAQFRERIIALARAITLGGTLAGMRAIGEAISGVPCQVYETWRLLDNAFGPAPGVNTWQALQTGYPTWSAIPATQTWQALEGIVTFTGLLGGGAPNEIVIQPRKTYSSSVSDQQQQGSDLFGIASVAEALRPAAALVSVDVTGPGIVVPVQISGAWADSQYWGITQLVTPANPADPAYAACRASFQGPNAGELPLGTYVSPSPPLSRTQGIQYSYAADVTTVTAQAVTGTSPNQAAVTDGQDFETVCFPGRKQTLAYLPAQAIMPPSQAASARTSSPVTVMCAPYSGPRAPVARAS